MTVRGIFNVRWLVLVVAALSLTVAAQAGAVPGKALPTPISVHRPALGTSAGGASLLIPVEYPIEYAGRVVKTRVALLNSDQRRVRVWTLRRRLGSGRVRLPDRRRSFTFVHQVPLSPKIAREVRDRPLIRTDARAVLDIEGDGRAELRSGGRGVLAPTTGRRKQLICGSIPHLRVDPGERLALPLPACDRPIKWTLPARSARGFARITGGRLIYRAPEQFRGGDRIRLLAKQRGAGAHASRGSNPTSAYAEVVVGATDPVVRAFGDSVTAGFGFLSRGEEMDPFPIGLGVCRPAPKEFNDACSSNSYNESRAEGPPNYTVDYGLGNKVSWAAQWAHNNGVTDYKNFAISGSEPKNWAPGGEFHKYLEDLEKDDPDYILFTLGANPLLSRVLVDFELLKCEGTKTFRECVEKEFREVELKRYLKEIYEELVTETTATIYVMQYHTAIPWSDLVYSNQEVAELEILLNREIAAVAAGFNSTRLKLVTPPHFNVGISPFPLFKATETCLDGTVPVDGPSAQSEGKQDEFEFDYRFGRVKEYCGGTPWIINRDTGIHPNTLGYAQMASSLPAPAE